MTMTTLDDMLLEQIRDLYDAEKQLVRALPKMAKAAASEDLKEAIEGHLEETQNQVSRLEQIFNELETAPKGKTCKAMKGLIEEGNEAAGGDAPEALVDLSVIAAAQRVEHYEISAYGTARAIASHLGRDRVAALLEETEEEEKAADAKLTEIASVLYEEAENGAENAAGKNEETQRSGKKVSSGESSFPRRAQRA